MTQKEALDILKFGYNVYLTGPAGSGKTHVLNEYISYLKQHDVDIGITASTGIAATHMGGMTIHSWTGLGVKNHITEFDLDALLQKKYLWKQINKAKVLIIDEVSMLHDFRLDLIDQILKAFKGSPEPFGGVQIILCGDFFQLPPVSRPGEPEAHFVYHSSAWHNAKLKICYLEEQHRQSDEILEILNAIRANHVSSEIKKKLEKAYKENKKDAENFQGLIPTRLYTHNEDVDTVNIKELEVLEGEVRSYSMTTRGNQVLVEILKKSCLAPEYLRLKKGAQVMFVKNNFEQGYVNGTLGEVISLKGEFGGPVVRIARTGKTLELDMESWKIEEEGVVKAEIKQYPLRLAWAITVHKSQGMSLDAVEVDLSKTFERGMGYVALSRVKTFEGLTILGINDEAFKVNDEVLEFDEELMVKSDQASDELEKLPVEELKKEQEEFLKFIAPEKSKKEKGTKLPTHQVTHELLKDELSLKEIAEKRGMTEQTILTHIEKLIEENKTVLKDISYLQKQVSSKHFDVIAEAIILKHDELGNWNLAPVKDYLDLNKKTHRLSPLPTYRDIQIVRLFIKPEQEAEGK